jgi:hypothetical protein
MEPIGYIISIPISFIFLWASLSLLKVQMSLWDVGTVSIITTVIDWVPVIGIISIPLLVCLVKNYSSASWGKAWQVFGITFVLDISVFLAVFVVYQSLISG